MTIFSIILYILSAFFILAAIGSVSKKEFKMIFSFLFIGVILGLFGWCTWPSSNTSDEKKNATDSVKQMPVEQQLATLDAGQLVSDTSLHVIRIRVLLKRISVAYNEPIDSIAEWTSKAQGAIHDEGKSETCEDILENMYLVGKVKDVKYKDAVTLYGYIKSR